MPGCLWQKPGGVYPHGAEHVVFAVLFAGKPVSETQGVRVLSEEERLLVRRRFPRTEPIPCAVMGLGMDVPRQTDPGTFRRQYGLEDEYLLYVGQVDERKNVPC